MITESLDRLSRIEASENPFPGLRPFELHESHLFFGRDGQSEKLLAKLQARHFLAVVGTSGSGKSSLVRAGLVPSLLGGMMFDAGSEWRIAIMRPSNDPIGNLARSLNSPEVYGSETKENAAIQSKVTEETLRRSTRGLIESVRLALRPSDETLLVVVDQFEELFRFARQGSSAQVATTGSVYQNDAAAFVKLLLEAAKPDQREANIYVVLTMRSDFLGDCSQFWDLPEAINESQYLIPRLTRDQLREVIEGPVAVGGGQIAPRLVNQLLNDIADNQDQLPILQHALMRTWDEWKDKRLEVDGKKHSEVHEGKAIDLCCYNATGGMAKALSQHADEAYSEVWLQRGDRGHQVAQKMFKALTEKGEDNREIRRPVEFGKLCAVAEASQDEVETIIEVFRQPHRSFLMPPVGTKLEEKTLVDISHESLIRVWTRLQQWTSEEAESATIYRRLTDAAGRKAELWRGKDLQEAEDWQAKTSPTEVWAERYDSKFKAAMDFLSNSQCQREKEIALAERQQREEAERTKRELAQAQALAEAQQQRAEEQAKSARKLRWLASAAIFLALLAGVAALVAISFYSTAEAARVSADEQRKLAQNQEREASAARDDAEKQKASAEAARDIADKQTIKANQEAERAELQRQKADQQTIISIQERDKAEQQTLEAQKQTRIAERQVAELFGLRADKVRSESTSFDVSGLLAVHSLKLEPTLQGYEALFPAMSLATRPVFERKPTGKVRQTILSGDGRCVAAIEEDGRPSIRDAETGRLRSQISEQMDTQTTLVLSHSGKFLATLNNERTVKVWNGEDGQLIGSLPNEAGEIQKALFSPNESQLVTVNDEALQLWNVPALQLARPPFQTGLRVGTMTFSRNSKTLALTFLPVVPVIPYPGRPNAIGQPKSEKLKPQVKLGIAAWNIESGAMTEIGNYGPVSALELSPDGNYLVVCDTMRSKMQTWEVATREYLGETPIVIFATALRISGNGNYLAAIGRASGSGESVVQVWRAYFAGASLADRISPVRGGVSIGEEIARWTIGATAAQPTFSQDENSLSLVTDDGTVLASNVFGGLTAASYGNVYTDMFGSTTEFFDPADDRKLITISLDGVRRVSPFTQAMDEILLLEPIKRDFSQKPSLSRDGRYLAVLGNIAKVYDLHTRKTLAQIKPPAWHKLLAFSPDGKLMASFNEDRTISVEKLPILNRLAGFQSDEPEVQAMALSLTGRYLATVSPDHRIRLRQLTLLAPAETEKPRNLPTDATEISTLVPQQNPTAIGFSPDDRWLAVASGNIVQLWETVPGKPFNQLSVHQFKHQARINALAFDPSGKLLATASDDRTVRIWNLASGQSTGLVLQHEDGVVALAFSPDGKQLATAAGNIARVWNISSGQAQNPVIKSEARLQALAFKSEVQISPVMPPGDRNSQPTVEKETLTLTTLDDKRNFEQWEIETGKSWNPSPPRPVSLSPDRTDENEQASKEEASSPYDSRQPWRLGYSEEFEVVALSPTGMVITSLGRGYELAFRRMALNPDGKSLATSAFGFGWNQGIQIWSVANQQMIANLPLEGYLSDFVYSADGRYLATTSQTLVYREGETEQTSVVQVWDVTANKPKELFEGIKQKAIVNRLVFSPDGKYLAMLQNNQVVFLNAANGQSSGVLNFDPESQTRAETIAFSPDGQYLVKRDLNGFDFWDMKSRQKFIRLTLPNKGPTDFSFNKTGDLLVTRSGEGVQIWHWRSQDLIKDACARLRRNFTYDEWTRFMGGRPYEQTCEQLPVHDSLRLKAVEFARDGNAEEAIKLFRRVAELEGDRKFDPQTEANWHISLKTEGNKLQPRVAKLLEEENLNQYEFEKMLAQFKAVAEIYDRPHKYDTLVEEGEGGKYETKVEPVHLWEGVCRLGSIYDRSAEVLDACNRAIAAYPESYEYRDLRGIALVLAGRPKEAVADFTSYLKLRPEIFAPGVAGNPQAGKADPRKIWIGRLINGEVAFTAEELKLLRKEYLRDWSYYRGH